MTDKEVLQKAIKMVTTHSIEDGMDRVVIASENMYVRYGFPKSEAIKCFIDENMIVECEDIEFLNIWYVKGFILSEDFAKAFWGEELLFAGKSIEGLPEDSPYQVFKTKELCQKAWVFHLQQMVLEPNPIDYLRKFVDNKKDMPYEGVAFKPMCKDESEGVSDEAFEAAYHVPKDVKEKVKESLLGLKTREIEVTSKPTYLSGVFSNKMSFSFKGGIERNDVVHFKGVEYLVSDITRVEGRDDVARVMAIEIECDIKDLKLEVGDKLTYKTI